jgi:hypothetical protein
MMRVWPNCSAHTGNPSTWEAEAGGLQVQDQLGLPIEILPQINK